MIKSFKEWYKEQPQCCGYPNCDGDLVGTAHTEKCPLFEEKHGWRTGPTMEDAYNGGIQAVIKFLLDECHYEDVLKKL